MGFFDTGNDDYRPQGVEPQLVGGDGAAGHFNFDEAQDRRRTDQQVRHSPSHTRQRQDQQPLGAVGRDNGGLVLVGAGPVSHCGDFTVPEDGPKGRFWSEMIMPRR